MTLLYALSAYGRMHLLLAGGRKSMAMVGMAVAQLLLGVDDRLGLVHVEILFVAKLSKGLNADGQPGQVGHGGQYTRFLGERK